MFSEKLRESWEKSTTLVESGETRMKQRYDTDNPLLKAIAKHKSYPSIKLIRNLSTSSCL